MEWPAYVAGAELCLLVGYRLSPQGILLGLPAPPLWLMAPPGPGLPCPHGGSLEVWSSLLEMGSVTNRSWQNAVGFSGFGCFFPCRRAVASSGQHKPLSGYLVILTRELIPKTKYFSGQPLFSMRRSCPHQCSGRKDWLKIRWCTKGHTFWEERRGITSTVSPGVQGVPAEMDLHCIMSVTFTIFVWHLCCLISFQSWV